MNKNIILVINKIRIDGIIDESLVQINEYNHSKGLYYGGGGSYTKFIGSYGRKIKFKTITPYYEKSLNNNQDKFKDYRQLAEYASRNIVPLISTSNAEYDGNYILTMFEHFEDNNGNFTASWELEEIIPYNITQKKFVTNKPPKYKKPTKISSIKSSGFKAKHGSSNTRFLLNKCPNMSKGSKNKACVKRLQRFLKSGGFYTKYKVNGVYGKHMVKAIKNAQLKRKLPKTGKWDEKTKKYYKKKYK